MGIFDTITDAIGGGASYVAKATSDFVKVGGTDPVGLLFNYGAGLTKKETAVTNVVGTAQAGSAAVTQAVVDTGDTIKSAGESVVKTISGGLDTAKKVLPIVAVGGLALLVLSKKK